MAATSVYDVIIVGGGPAGCATALSLARSNPDASFLLLDDADATAFKIGESLPAVATRTLDYLAPALSARLAHDTSLGKHNQCTGNASAWASQEIQEQYAIMNLHGMGWHLDRSLFDECLRDAVRDVCGKQEHGVPVSALGRARFTSVEKHGGAEAWSVHAKDLNSGETNCYKSKWVIDATGRKASVATKLGAKTGKNDSLLAFYALFVLPSADEVKDMDHQTLIEATDSGWWYTSQVPHARIVVYHTDDADPTSKLARRQDGFMDLLHTTTHISPLILKFNYNFLLHHTTAARFPRCTAAGSSVLQPFGDDEERWCAVGDAAMAFDPLSSQGIITALNVGCFVGSELAKRVGIEINSPEDGEVLPITNCFELVREKYEKEKRYFYQQVQRFDGKFWQRRQS